MPASIVWNRKPLPQNLLAPLPPTAIRAHGWLRGRVAAEAAPDALGSLAQACLLNDAAQMEAMQAKFADAMQAEAATREMLRALPYYHAATADKAVPLYLLRSLRALRDSLLAGQALPAGEAANMGDATLAALWLYNMTGQKGLVELCHLIKAQAPDWMSTFHVFPQTRAVVDAPDEATDAYWRVHGPTLAAALKVPALQALFEGGLKNETGFDTGVKKLMRYHGAAHGLINADPLLAGGNPSRGVAPQTAWELAYTLQTVLWAQGNPAHGDMLEHLLYGPLLHAGAPQAANQLVATGAGPAGLSQAASALWMASADGGLAAIGYAPCEARWRANGSPVRITVDTNYPYELEIRLHIALRGAARFPLRLRIPAWAAEATAVLGDGQQIDCAPGTFAAIDREWRDGDTVTLTLPMPILTESLYHQTIAVRRGPLTYALPVEADTQWNIALVEAMGFEADTRAGIPVIQAYATQVPGWQRSGDVPAAPPVSPPGMGELCRRTLYPYGETDARIAQFPKGMVAAEKEDTP